MGPVYILNQWAFNCQARGPSSNPSGPYDTYSIMSISTFDFLLNVYECRKGWNFPVSDSGVHLHFDK